jgi:hypothetical protein
MISMLSVHTFAVFSAHNTLRSSVDMPFVVSLSVLCVPIECARSESSEGGCVHCPNLPFKN